MNVKTPLFGRTLSQLTELVVAFGLPRFTAKQICHWLYTKDISSISEMTSLSKAARQLIDEHHTLGLTPPSAVSSSKDGTKKYLFAMYEETFI